MDVVTDLAAMEPPGAGSVVTIGSYDGVHLGHRAVLGELRALADSTGAAATVVTFDRHPAMIVRPEFAPKLLTDLDQKLELLEATGAVDVVVVVRFDWERSQEEPEDFVEEVLVDGLRARAVIVCTGILRNSSIVISNGRATLPSTLKRHSRSLIFGIGKWQRT